MYYIIDYNTGVLEGHNGTLETAKESAIKGMSYTSENVAITNDKGEVITTSRWYGVKPDEEDDVLVHTSEGFYQTWDDELS